MHRIMAEDERVQRYERAVAMATLGLAHTLHQLDSELFTSGEGEEWKRFLTEGRLWKLAKHENPSVRPHPLSPHPAMECVLVSDQSSSV